MVAPQAAHRVAPAATVFPQFVQNVMDSRSTPSIKSRSLYFASRLVCVAWKKNCPKSARSLNQNTPYANRDSTNSPFPPCNDGATTTAVSSFYFYSPLFPRRLTLFQTIYGQRLHNCLPGVFFRLNMNGQPVQACSVRRHRPDASHSRSC